jgi:predicted RNA-binding Zn-ribbon protein involved in translation (DUF1610 family)
MEERREIVSYQVIDIQCTCGNKMWRSVGVIGRRYMCPSCGQVWFVRIAAALFKEARERVDLAAHLRHEIETESGMYC